MGMQEYAVVVDSSDNIYVISGSGNTLVAQAFTKGVGFTWTGGTVRSQSMPSYSDGRINNIAASWHNVGTSGTIMVVVGHTNGRAQSTNDVSYALLNCQYLLTGTGSLFRNSAGARNVLIYGTGDVSNFTNFVNPDGNTLDVVAAPSTTDRGYVVSASLPSTGLGESRTYSVFRYVLASDGTSISDSDGGTTTDLGFSFYATRDAGAKLRVIGLTSTVFAAISVDAFPTYGISVLFFQNFGTSSTFTILGQENLDGVNATMPTPSNLDKSSAWDVVYDSVGAKLWFYYFSSADGRRLMRTSIDVNTYQATADQIEVSAAVGPASSTNLALRTHRGPLNGQQVLITVANRSSGGSHTTQYVTDSFNQAPTAPTLTSKANFDATASASFAWTFNDPNAGDTQSAYEIQINTSGGVFAYDSGKVSSATCTFVAAGVAATGNNATINPALPAGVVVGDTMLLWASIRNSGTGTVNTPTGWTQVAAFGNTSLFAKIYASGDAAPSVTFTGGAANEDTLGQVCAFRNLPIRTIASATVLNGSAQNVNYPALTVPLNNSVVLILAWKQDDVSPGYGTISGCTKIGDVSSTTGNDASESWLYSIQTTASNVSNASLTASGGASAISRGLTYSLGPYGNTPTASNHTLAASALTNGGSWQWRVKTWDAAGLEGPYSNYGTFSTASGGTVTITDPATDNPAGIINNSYNVQWSVANTTQASYRVKVVRTSDSSVLSDTGFVVSVATSATITGLLSDVEYRIEVTVRNSGLVESATGTRLITASFAAPDTPLMMLSSTSSGYILVTVTNPTPTGARPSVTTNQILRRVSNSGADYVAVGTCGNNGTYKDYAVASGVTYQYVVRALGA